MKNLKMKKSYVRTCRPFKRDYLPKRKNSIAASTKHSTRQLAAIQSFHPASTLSAYGFFPNIPFILHPIHLWLLSNQPIHPAPYPSMAPFQPTHPSSTLSIYGSFPTNPSSQPPINLWLSSNPSIQPALPPSMAPFQSIHLLLPSTKSLCPALHPCMAAVHPESHTHPLPNTKVDWWPSLPNKKISKCPSPPK